MHVNLSDGTRVYLTHDEQFIYNILKVRSIPKEFLLPHQQITITKLVNKGIATRSNKNGKAQYHLRKI